MSGANTLFITRYTDYSLRVLIYLAAQPERRATIQQIADAYDISKNHLMKIVQQLASAEYLDATRGKHGGIQLAKAPSKILLGELIQRFEHGTPLVECFGSDNHCKIAPACRLKSILNEALQQFYTTLNRYTLHDLVAPPHRKSLHALLALQIR